ncbi:selenocysteine-specific translation elongation factor [Acidithiobacillus sp.]|uniref:selenocysteine-specific translation elongation factor n=2 Tax=Acidithiobacillus sp. TaxID=1872118 RepID=UPI003D072ED9
MIIGTAGHIDHGKTALVHALTGVDADRLKEEKARGITIDLGYAYIPLPNGEVLGFVDVPGHEKLIHNMLAGATGIDFVLVVVAADDGVMPQTREHVQILDLLGLDRGAVVMTKVDRVAPGRIDEVAQEIRTLLAGTPLANCPLFPVSSVTGLGVAPLYQYLEGLAERIGARQGPGHFRLAVDRCFTLAGTGTVVTGTAYSGEVRVGDRLLLSPAGIPVRVRGMHVQNRRAELGRGGERCALNLAGVQVSKECIHRGDWIVAPSLHAPCQRMDVRLRLLAGEVKPLHQGMPIHFHLGAADIMGRVTLLEGDTMRPGQEILAQIALNRSTLAQHGDRFVLRDPSARQTIGGGIVLDPHPPARGRRKPARLAALRALETDRPEEALARLLPVAATPLDLTVFQRDWNLRDADAEALWSTVPMVRMQRGESWLGLAFEAWDALGESALAALSGLHQSASDLPGATAAQLRMQLPQRPLLEVLEARLAALRDAGRLARHGPWFHLPGHLPQLTPQDTENWKKMAPLLIADDFQPPRVRDIAQELGMDEKEVRGLLYRVARTGQAFKVAHDHFFPREIVARLATAAEDLGHELADGRFTAAQYRDRIDVGRKLAIQILEFFDRSAFTRRQGNLRSIRQLSEATFGAGGNELQRANQ